MSDAPTVDGYLAALPDDQRTALEHVRAEVRRLVPDAVETISYGMPTFKLHGRGLISYAAWKRHCSLYPLSGSFLADYAAELEGFDRTKGSVHFTPDAPLSDALLEGLVRARLADLGEA